MSNQSNRLKWQLLRRQIQLMASLRKVSVVTLLLSLVACVSPQRSSNVAPASTAIADGDSEKSPAALRTIECDGGIWAASRNGDSQVHFYIDELGVPKNSKRMTWIGDRALVSATVTPLGDRPFQIADVRCQQLPSGWVTTANSQYVAIQELDNLWMTIYDRASGSVVARTSKIQSRAQAISFSPAVFPNTDEGRTLLVGGTDGIIYRWWWQSKDKSRSDIEGSSKLIERYVGHAGAIEALQWHPNGETFFSSDRGGVLSAWQVYEKDTRAGAHDKTRSFSDLFTDISVRSSFNRFAIPSVAITANPVPPSKDPVRVMAVSPGGELLATVDEGGTIELWRVRGMELLDRQELVEPSARSSDRARPRAVNWDAHGSQFSVLDHLGRIFLVQVSPAPDRLGLRDSMRLHVRAAAGRFLAIGPLGMAIHQEGLVRP